MIAVGCLTAIGVGLVKGILLSDNSKSDMLLSDDVEVLSNDETGQGEPKFKTWVDTGNCVEERNGVLEKVGTYRICGEVSLGFSHKDDCRIDEDCKTGKKE